MVFFSPSDKSLYASLLFKHGSFLPDGFQFITLENVEAVGYSEMVLSIYQTKRHQFPDHHNINWMTQH